MILSQSRWAMLAAGLSGCAVLAGLVSGPGYRWGLLSLSTGFSLLRVSVYGGILVLAVGLVAVYRTGVESDRWGLVLSLVALLSAGLTVAVPLSWHWTAKQVPSIHDITTDTENPPSFVAVVPLREEAPNPLEYGGDPVARQQRNAYPDIQPLLLEANKSKVFQGVRETAREMGWEIVSASPGDGRLEATDTTFWFGFKDDVVVRIGARDGKTRVDVRSVSRVGKGDVGTNARRIRRFLHTLAERFR